MVGDPDLSQQLNSVTGLTSAHARARLEQDGHNELPWTRQRSTVAIGVDAAREPMFLLLIVSVTIYLGLGDLREALVLALSLFVIFGITIVQERKIFSELLPNQKLILAADRTESIRNSRRR